MDSFWGNIFRGGKDNGDALSALREVPIFSGLSRRQLRSLERIIHRREYARDEIVFRQGEAGVGMFIIHRGRVAIIQDPGHRTLAELGAGDFFGEIALLNESPRSASAVALEASTLFGFFQPDLLSILERQPTVGVAVLRGLSEIAGERLIRTEQALRECERTRNTSAGGTDSDPATANSD